MQKKANTIVQTEQGAPYNPYCQIFASEDNRSFDVYLSEEIATPDLYTELLNLLFTADESVEIHLKINSPGGNMDTGLQIQDAIENSLATVIGYLSGSADSAASAIFCSCDSHVVGHLGLMLVHSCSMGFFAPIHDFVQRGELIYTQNKKWLERTYAGFVSEEEIEDILVNKRQLMLDSDDIVLRLENMYRLREEEAREELEEADTIKIDLVELAKNVKEILRLQKLNIVE
jgi:ATP-dependent protease ClpP protease subunit